MGRRHGILTNLIVGICGALLGAFIADLLGITFAGIWGSLLVSSAGAILFLAILGMFRRKPLL
jgi:uncharacterized membrane protein YeaQ/YmgE (transglycosylase-associated protein family)